MLRADTTQNKQLARDLLTFAHRAYPFATKSTVNGMAFEGQKIARGNIREQMITRNRWTGQSVQVEPTKTLNVQQQASKLGSVADYMATQEFGGTRAKKGKEGVPIPTSFSSGEGESAKPRKKMPRPRNRMRRVKLSKKTRTYTTKAQQRVATVKHAVATGKRYFFMDLGRSKGIFRATGSKRKPRIKMVWSMSKPSVNVPRNAWLEPASHAVDPAPIYRDALRFQLRRHRIFVRS